MAIRSTNAGRHMPTGGMPSGGGPDPTRGYANADGPGGSTVDYGPHRGGFSFNGLTSPRWDDRDPRFDATPDQLAADAAARQPYIDRRNELFAGNDAFQKAKAAGDIKGQLAAMQQMRAQGQQDRFVAQGGTPETWQNRFDPNNNWPVPHVPGAGGGNGMVTPRSPSGNYQYGPGRPGPTPPGVPPQAAQAQALPPSQNPMITGYGGPGVVSGGQGGQFGSAGGSRMDMSNFARDEQMALQNARMRQGGTDWWNPGGGYNPGQSKSGMGQSPYGLGASTTGNPYMPENGMGGGAPYYNPNAAMMGGGMNDYLMSMMMNGMAGRMSPGQGFGGRSAFSMDPGMMGFGYAPMY